MNELEKRCRIFSHTEESNHADQKLDAVGCDRRSQSPSTADPQAAVQGATEDQKQREAFIDYLGGKTIPLTGDSDHVVRRDEITAVQFADSAVSYGSPYTQGVTILLSTGTTKYALHGNTEYRRVEDTFAFFGFKVDSVEEQ